MLRIYLLRTLSLSQGMLLAFGVGLTKNEHGQADPKFSPALR